MLKVILREASVTIGEPKIHYIQQVKRDGSGIVCQAVRMRQKVPPLPASKPDKS